MMNMRWVPLLLSLLAHAQPAIQPVGQTASQSDSQPALLSDTRTTDYDSGEQLIMKIFEPLTSRASGYGLIKFEEQPTQPNAAGLVTFEDHSPTNKLKFEDQSLQEYPDQSSLAYMGANEEDLNYNSQGQEAAFQDTASVTEKPHSSGQKKRRRRRRRRRRKPRVQAFGGQPAGFQGANGFQGAMHGVDPYIGPGSPAQFYRPPSGALESVMAALTAVAQHDDLQCVPRLLCETLGGATSGAANGATSGATSALLRAITTIQPLLTMIGGLSGSPLAVFGRAALLGAGGPDACRPAYPACPADPQQLVHYLNNHNGGFFRFFNSPPPPPPGPSYGLYNTDPNDSGQSYGLYQPDPSLYSHSDAAPTYGLYQNTDQQYGNGYKGYRSDNPNKFNDKYGPNYLGYKDTKSTNIEKRILNSPGNYLNENKDFLTEPGHGIKSDDKKTKQFKFPEEQRGTRQVNGKADQSSGALGFFFPGSQSNRQYDTSAQAQAVRTNDGIPSEDGVQIVYVVRGDGDPHHPEVVRLRPGEKLH